MSNKARRMLVLLLIILREAGPTAACSSSCSSVCGCSFMELPSVPQYLPTTITVLYLYSNAISNLSQSDFSRYRSLTYISLSSNQISMIHNNTFQVVSSLTRLYLNINHLTNLTAGTFEGLGNLQDLWLHNNQLTSLPAGIFVGLCKLTVLYLNGNQLTSLPSDIFVGLGNLQILSLYNNQLTSLSADIFLGLGNLQVLYLRNNKLTSLSADIFVGLGNLQDLWLNQNKLETLPPSAYDILANISTVNIDNNPWQCDCRMAPFKQRMNGSYWFENQITCAGPANLTGQYLRDVNPEDLICNETTPVYSTSSTKHIADSTDSPFAFQSTMSTESNAGPTDSGIVLAATLGAILGLFVICTIAFAVWCMHKRRQRDPTPQQGLSNTNPTGTSSGHDQIPLQAVATNAETNSQSETPLLDTEDSQHIYNVPTDDDPDTAEYNTIGEVDQSESPHRGAGNRQSLDSFGYLVLPPSLPPENQTDRPAASYIESSDADEAEYDDTVSPSQRSQPGSEQMQHHGSFNNGYEVPSPSLRPGEGPKSHKYVNSHVTAAAKDAAAGPQLMVYENEDEIESAKEGPQSHKYVNSHMTAAAKDDAVGPQDVVYENEDEIESAKEGPQSHKYESSHMTAAAKDAAAGPQDVVYGYEND